MSHAATAPGDFDLYDPSVHAEIFEFYAREHETGPIFRSERYGGFWVVVGYDAVATVLRDWQHFSSEMWGDQNIFFNNGLPRMPPIQSDPPEQQEYRRYLNPHFSPGQATGMEPAARAIADTLIDAFIERGTGDLVKELTNPLPGLVFFEQLLQVPKADLPKCRHWVDTGQYEAKENPELSKQANKELGAYVYQFVERRKNEPPRGDIVDLLFNAEIGGRQMTTAEIVPVIMVLLGGGLETTSNAMANAFYQLMMHPEMKQRLIDDPAAIPTAVEEFLRFEGSLHGLQRIVTEDVEVSGTFFKKGDKVLVSYAGANRDPHEFDDPTTCVLDRKPNRHVAFGVGVHRCVGSNIARMNLRVMLEEVLRRLPDFHLEDGTELKLQGAFTRGFPSLPVAFTPGPRLGITIGA